MLELHADLPAPAIPAGHARIRVEACALNFADTLLCRGTYQERPPLPLTPGLEIAGILDGAVGPLPPGLQPGDRVLALTALPHGGLAEQALAPLDGIFALPADLDPVRAAALLITYQTAWFGLHRRAGLRAGEVVLIHAAAGGTGSAAVQLALAAGATVIATAGGADKVDLCRRLGTHHVIDSRAEGDLVTEIRDLTHGRGVDVAFDPVGGDLFDVSRRVLAWEGRLVVVGFASGRPGELPTNHLLVKNFAVLGLHWPRYRLEAPELLQACHRELLRLLQAGTIDPLIGSTPSLEEARHALASLAGGSTAGKLVVTLGDSDV